jgi:hypothetical protein
MKPGIEMNELIRAIEAMKPTDEERHPHLATGADRIYAFECPCCLVRRQLDAAIVALSLVRQGVVSAADDFLNALDAQGVR